MRWSECCGCVMAFSAAHQRHMMLQYSCGSGKTNKCVYLQTFEAALFLEEEEEAIFMCFLH